MMGNSRAIHVQEPCNEKSKKDGLGIEYKKGVAVFNQETCQRCGQCLTLYPFLEMPKDETAAEISHMIEADLSGLDAADQK
jgi:Fe-S-cluster-containing hydrogenase component 2